MVWGFMQVHWNSQLYIFCLSTCLFTYFPPHDLLVHIILRPLSCPLFLLLSVSASVLFYMPVCLSVFCVYLLLASLAWYQLICINILHSLHDWSFLLLIYLFLFIFLLACVCASTNIAFFCFCYFRPGYTWQLQVDRYILIIKLASSSSGFPLSLSLFWLIPSFPPFLSRLDVYNS